MTEDHVFPQGLVSSGQRQVKKILYKADPNYRGRQGTFLAQNGFKTSTLCADCNNRVLGADLDPSLITVYKAASVALHTGRFPVIGSLDLLGINLNKVSRAVAGHLLALDDMPQARHKMARYLRRFVLHEEVGLDQALRFHMWFYPSMRQGMLKDLNHFEFGTDHDPMWISAFKTYPLAFAFSTAVQNRSFQLAGMIDLTLYVKSGATGLFDIRIPTRPVVDFNWPFAPHPNGAILTGANDSITTLPYRKRS
ncbi:hypothetical protein [Pseudomonas syringae]|uniref:hypothetical protein n=1 Tax=Pseudomonas syringae TaxID=317 RepID=UPI001CA8EE42|nr:hypothetical protein [Pseudomonas syringae]